MLGHGGKSGGILRQPDFLKAIQIFELNFRKKVMAKIKPKPLRHGNGWRVSFCLFGEKYVKYVGKSEHYAELVQCKINTLVVQMRYGFVEIPKHNIGDFVFSQTINKPKKPHQDPSKSILVLAFIDIYISEIDSDSNSSKTKIIHANHLKKFASKHYQRLFIKDVTVIFFERYKKYRKKQKVMAKTINKELYTFREIFQCAIEKEYLTENVLDHVKKEKEDEAKNIFRTTSEIKSLLARKNFTVEEIKKIKRFRHLNRQEIKHIIRLAKERLGEDHWIIPIIITFAHTGIRRKELIELTWLNVDFTKEILYVYSDKQSRKVQKVCRGVYMSSKLKAVLEEQKSRNKERWVFPGPNGGQLSVHTLYPTFVRALKDSDYEGIGFHCFRHSFISILADNGAKLQEIGNLVGHTNSEMTAHYTHVTPESIKRAIENAFSD